MAFRKLRSVALTEEKQGLIRFTCLTYREQPEWIQQKIDLLCDECGGEYSAALREVMCTRRSMVVISQQYFVSENTLCRARRRFYESWDKGTYSRTRAKRKTRLDTRLPAFA